MPVFDQIEIFLDGSYPRDEQRSFIFKSRCVCNYLERALREKKFETALSRVNIHCTKDANEVRVTPLRGAPFLEVRIKYGLPPLSDLDEAALQRHYAHTIDLGLRAAGQFMPVPYKYCISTLRRFKEEGFRNEWVQADMSWDKRFRCEVSAQLTTDRFTLWQRIYRDGVPIAERRITETMPREMLFVGYLGSLSLDRSGNIVYKRKAKPLSKFNLASGKFVESA